MVRKSRQKSGQEAEEVRGPGGTGTGHIIPEPQHQVRDHTQVCCVKSDDSDVCVYVCVCVRSLRSYYGSGVPLHCTASGLLTYPTCLRNIPVRCPFSSCSLLFACGDVLKRV